MKKTIYLYKSGHLERKNHSLVLIDKKGTPTYIPIQQIDIIICFSEITLNKRALSILNAFEVTILFFNYYGNYIGRFTPKRYMDGKVLLKQIECYDDDTIRLSICKKIMISSLKNENAVLKYYNIKRGKKLIKQIELIEDQIEQLKVCQNINNLMLLEAQAKRIYYSAFDSILESKVFIFDQRSKNPPENEVNAMMSYGYAILYSHYLSVLDRSSLYPQISYIHSLSKNCDSLQFDLADILKSCIIDRTIFRIIRRNQVTLDMFDWKDDGRCYLNQSGVKLLVSEIERQFNSTVLIHGKSYSYKNIISREVHLLSNYVKDQKNGYDPYLMKW